MATRRSRTYTPPRRRSVVVTRRAKKPAPRRQYVTLRTRQRKEISRQMSDMFKRGVLVLAVFAIGAFICWHWQDWIQRQLSRHTPTLELKAPAELTGVPVFSVLPKRRWLLWVPGVPTTAAHRIQQKFPSIQRADIQTHFFENRILIQLEPRQPLVQYNTQYMDQEGVLFSLSQAPQTPLPQLLPAHAPPPASLGPWLFALSRVSWLWSDVTELKENSQGSWALILTSGPVLVWGFTDENVPAKAEMLQKIMTHAAANHGGALRADLRFFREGRIIVEVRRPIHA